MQCLQWVMRSESLVANTGVQEPADLSAIPLLAAVTYLCAHRGQLGPLFLSAARRCSASPYTGLLRSCKVYFRLQKEDYREAQNTHFQMVCLSA